MSDTREKEIALKEAYEIHNSDEYFHARPQIESASNRKIFESAHNRAWDSCQSLNYKTIAELNAMLTEANEREAYESGLASSRLLQIAELVKALEYIKQWSHQLVKDNKCSMVNDLIFVRAQEAIAKAKQVKPLHEKSMLEMTEKELQEYKKQTTELMQYGIDELAKQVKE